jgi:hypothetical protein
VSLSSSCFFLWEIIAIETLFPSQTTVFLSWGMWAPQCLKYLHHSVQASAVCFILVWGQSMPFPVVARSKTWVCGCSLTGIEGSNPAGVIDIFLLWELCAVSCKDFSDGPINCAEESYRLWCVWLRSWNLN